MQSALAHAVPAVAPEHSHMQMPAPTHPVAGEGHDDAGERVHFAGDYFFSTMPVRDLIRAIDAPVPA